MSKREYKLQHRNEVKQLILPALIHYLKLLELPNLELENTIREELEENQLVEEISQELEEPETREDTKVKEDVKEVNEFDILELFAEERSISYENPEEQSDPLDNVPANDDILYNCLMRQAMMEFKDKELEIAILVISNIEEDGHLAATPEELSKEGYEIAIITKIIKRIQHFEPIGCAWCDIREPLLVQLKVMGYKDDSPEYILVRDHLKDLMNNNIRNIMSKFNITEEQLLKAKKVIMKLNPKPGWRYSNEPSKYVMPDFIVYWQDNKLVASLNDQSIPHIRIKNQYLEMLKSPKNIPPEQLEFIKQKALSAKNLIIAIEQRRKTLTRIINSLLEHQRDFFEKGYSYLKPITMTDFAKQLNVNPSTISRAIANKFLESPWGIHKLKFFFNVPVGNTDKRVIFGKIKEIIESEDKTSPLSDTQIVKKLSRAGIIISRRTITKYREQLGIPAQQFRRKL